MHFDVPSTHISPPLRSAFVSDVFRVIHLLHQFVNSCWGDLDIWIAIFDFSPSLIQITACNRVISNT